MPVPGFSDYKRREYCNSIKCPVQMQMNGACEGTKEYDALRATCQKKCIHTAYEFHHWLIENGFLVVKPEKGK